jgi:hypothetical protein
MPSLVMSLTSGEAHLKVMPTHGTLQSDAPRSEPVDRDDLPPAQEQDREQRARLPGRKVEQTVIARYLERPQDPEVERHAHGRSTGVNRSSTAAIEALRRRESRARTGQA